MVAVVRPRESGSLPSEIGQEHCSYRFTAIGGDRKLEQLPLPCLSVTTDLVSGTAIVRDRGDAVHAILKSIILPVLSVPIVREGQALIDGGLVNNIPADVLVSMGCNFVIAASVTAKWKCSFARSSQAARRPTRSLRSCKLSSAGRHGI